MAVKQQQLISPAQLYSWLLVCNTKQIQCESTKSKLVKQKSELVEQLKSLRYNKQQKLRLVPQLQQLIEARAKLRCELQALGIQRHQFNIWVINEVKKLRNTPVQIRSNVKQMEELDELKDKNCKMQVRLRQMVEYSNLLKKRVDLLEQEKHIVKAKQNIYPLRHQQLLQLDMLEYMDARGGYRSIEQRLGEIPWRQKINAIKIEQQLYEGQRKAEIRNRQKYQQQLQQLRVQNAINKVHINSRLRNSNIGATKLNYP